MMLRACCSSCATQAYCAAGVKLTPAVEVALEGDAALQAAKAGRWPADLVAAAIDPVPVDRKHRFTLDLLRQAVVLFLPTRGPAPLSSSFLSLSP